MAGNLLIVHGGGPTAVINSSLYGAIRQAQDCPLVDRVYAAIGGTGGLLKEKLRDVTDLPDAESPTSPTRNCAACCPARPPPSAPAGTPWKPPSMRPWCPSWRNTASVTS